MELNLTESNYGISEGIQQGILCFFLAVADCGSMPVLLWKYCFVDAFVSSLMRPIMVCIGKDSNFFVLTCCKIYIVHGLGIGQDLGGYCKLSV